MEKLKEKSVKLYTQEVHDNIMKVKVVKLKEMYELVKKKK
jgi:hypothetical protein